MATRVQRFEGDNVVEDISLADGGTAIYPGYCEGQPPFQFTVNDKVGETVFVVTARTGSTKHEIRGNLSTGGELEVQIAANVPRLRIKQLGTGTIEGRAVGPTLMLAD